MLDPGLALHMPLLVGLMNTLILRAAVMCSLLSLGVCLNLHMLGLYLEMARLKSGPFLCRDDEDTGKGS